MAWSVRIRDGEECLDAQPFLSPDIIITVPLGPQIEFDHAVADADEALNRGGLRSKAMLHTAVLIQLFSDRRIRPDQVHPDPRSRDPRGWWGDTVDLRTADGEAEIGSHLWLLRRSVLTQEVIAQAEEYCREALQPLIDQGAVARIDVVAEAQSMNAGGHPATGVLAIQIDGYAQDGQLAYSQEFQVLWDQIATERR